MNFEQLYAPSLKELFVQKLQGMILSGELPMGEKLPSERELCQQMGVSRAVVNGGITELARQGFLEVRPRQGTFVADYRRDGNMETLMAIMDYNGGMLGKEEIRSILEVRWVLEQMTLHRLNDNASDAQLEQLGKFVDQLGEHPLPAQAAEIAFAFHHDHEAVKAPDISFQLKTVHQKHCNGAFFPPCSGQEPVLISWCLLHLFRLLFRAPNNLL